ncbi:MAG: nitric-oxide reductase large subunit [Verrucomicrobia bacterium]|nr:MAG: nitric-oxide reductase large subunit [Verrucomicrobiota bacterium]
MNGADATQKPLSAWWRRGALIVMALGFLTLTIVTFLTYQNAPPIPAQVVTENGQVLFTSEDIEHGQEIFLKYGLMEHGTMWGHGAYLGPDYSATYLHREAEITRDALAQARFQQPAAKLNATDLVSVEAAVKGVLKPNRYDNKTDKLVYTAAEAASFAQQVQEWTEYFAKGAPGQPAGYIKQADELKPLTAYFAWAAWATRANRPGRDYSFTSNWPYDPLAGNTPSAHTYLWSAISLMFLLGGLGTVLFLCGKFNYLGWRGDERPPLSTTPAARLTLTPSQKATALYFLVVGVLFLLQSLVGGALAHYRVEPNAFYQLNLAKYLPYNLLRTWHLQLAVFWIATAWVAGGLFLAPLIGGAEPRGQKAGVLVLLGALAVVVFGSLGGEYLGINNQLGQLWFWLGHQGSEYLDLGRFWQVLLAVGLIFWLWLMFRALKPALAANSKTKELTTLFLIAATGVVLFYVPAFFYGPRTNFAIIDNWRFWIIHLWVEGFFELFATVIVALMFVQMGVVTIRTATRVVYLDAILYLAGGIVGTAHHWYFTGQETLSMALGGCFSALEVVPLTLLTLDAWDFIRLHRAEEVAGGTALATGQKWAINFLIAVGVWNFVGAGVFGFLINMPIVSYFEMGTTLTPNHGHAAMFGVFGMLALAVLVFGLRAMLADETWQRLENYFRVGFWGLNLGLGLMIVLNLFPAGVLQLFDVLKHGYAHARSLEFTMHGWFHTTEWIRLLGDMVFLVVGVIPLTLGIVMAVLKSGKRA